jgi:molybdopterin biosynthesis enzyme
LLADGDISDAEGKALAEILGQRHGKLKVILVQGAPRSVIVKTTQVVAPLIRETSGTLTVGGKRLRVVLTSGGIGKLKRRAKAGESTGGVKVPQR